MDGEKLENIEGINRLDVVTSSGACEDGFFWFCSSRSIILSVISKYTKLRESRNWIIAKLNYAKF